MENTFLSNLPDLVKWIESNPLVVTLTSGGAIVWLFANLRSIFTSIVAGVKACISFTITNTYEDARGTSCGYNLKLRQIVFNEFLANTKALWERTVNVDLNNAIDICNFERNTNAATVYEISFGGPPTSNDANANNVTSPSKIINTYGFSLRWIFGHICAVERSYKLDGQRITMNTSIRVFFARKKVFMKKLEEAITEKTIASIRLSENSNTIAVFNANTYAGHKMKRSLDSIFTKNDVHKDLCQSIKNFIDNKSIYQKLNYPYNYCGLLYGVPGSGKTSTILAIASELKRNVYYINLSQTNTTQLLQAFNDNVNQAIFVFEDIDAISYKGASTRNADDGKDCENDNEIKLSKIFGISLSDLLNITDGLLASDGAICLFTTNHIEKLDPAFLRAGRMNKVVEFTYMTPELSKKMVKTYLGVSMDNMKDGIKPAELQECILDVLLGKQTIDVIKEKFCVR